MEEKELLGFDPPVMGVRVREKDAATYFQSKHIPGSWKNAEKQHPSASPSSRHTEQHSKQLAASVHEAGVVIDGHKVVKPLLKTDSGVFLMPRFKSVPAMLDEDAELKQKRRIMHAVHFKSLSAGVVNMPSIAPANSSHNASQEVGAHHALAPPPLPTPTPEQLGQQEWDLTLKDLSVHKNCSSVKSRFAAAGVDGWRITAGSLSTQGNAVISHSTNLHIGVPRYFVASDAFHTDWTDFTNLKFKYKSYHPEIYQLDSYSQGFVGDIHIENNIMAAWRRFPHPPASGFESYDISLTSEEGWTLYGGASSLKDVLKRVTSFSIRAEDGGDLSEFAALAEVQLTKWYCHPSTSTDQQ
eukprot:GILK01002850.1.p1 GENE.GILK01002850.1~~GILK01002850.1.p1  ORF type:complete len:396 (-),score=72.40 GILK01002850.1:165-1229(-)